MPARVTLLTMWFAMCALTTTAAHASNCALRNPDRQIYDIFPDATTYRSVVELISLDHRSAIEKQLGSSLAFGDLGKHTVYLVFRDGVPLGFIHARSEVGARGSVELVWAMDLDLRVKDFRVQRSREKHTDEVRADAFRSQLVGKSAEQLRSLMSDPSKAVETAPLQVSTDAKQIAQLAVLSGTKTLIITDLAFRNTTFQARLLGHVHKAFPETRKVTKIKDPFNSNAFAIIEQRTGSSSHLIDRDSFTVLRSLDDSGTTLGVLVVSRPSSRSTGPEQWWTVAPSGRILKAWTIGDSDDSVQEDLSKLTGKNLDSVVELADATGEVTAMYAVEVLAALAAADIGK